MSVWSLVKTIQAKLCTWSWFSNPCIEFEGAVSLEYGSFSLHTLYMFLTKPLSYYLMNYNCPGLKGGPTSNVSGKRIWENLHVGFFALLARKRLKIKMHPSCCLPRCLNLLLRECCITVIFTSIPRLFIICMFESKLQTVS